jgi:hypothetical protein
MHFLESYSCKKQLLLVISNYGITLTEYLELLLKTNYAAMTDSDISEL